MSSQKIPGVGRIDVSRIANYNTTKTGVLCSSRDNDIVCHIPCATHHRDRVIDDLYNARHRNSPQIDFSYLDAENGA